MPIVNLIDFFGSSAESSPVVHLLEQLGTYKRPALDEENERSYYDWLLIRRKGLELGFVDSEYHNAGPSFRWRTGDLILVQLYFYAGFDDIAPYTGELPFSLLWSDTQAQARVKLAAHEASRHSYRTDTWDVPALGGVPGYRLTVTYTDDCQRIDRIACRVMPAPFLHDLTLQPPSLQALADALGQPPNAPTLATLWAGHLDHEAVRAAREDHSIDFTDTFGVTLGFAGKGKSMALQSVTLHQSRYRESVQWLGELPYGLSFDDSPEQLFQKIPQTPVQHEDSTLTGHAVWHLSDYTLHVLYSHMENRLLHVKLISPGTWKSVFDPSL
jgi:hypothetical protein